MPSPTGNSGTTEQLVLAGGKRLALVKNFVLKQLSKPLQAAGFLHPNVIYLYQLSEYYWFMLWSKTQIMKYYGKFTQKCKSFFYLRNTKEDFINSQLFGFQHGSKHHFCLKKKKSYRLGMK